MTLLLTLSNCVAELGCMAQSNITVEEMNESLKEVIRIAAVLFSLLYLLWYNSNLTSL